MATRTVRLDEEAESALKEVRDATGLPISEALKRGLHTLRAQLRDQADRSPFEIYQTLDLGAGGYAKAPSSEAKRAIRQALNKKLHR